MADILQNILKFNPFKKDETSVLGIDLGSSSIKVVQLKRKKGRAVLETYGALALGPYAGLEVGRATNLSSDKIAEALLDLMKEANVTTKNCAISIPFRSSLVTLIDIPTLDQKKLAEMIPLEARKYIPVPISEVSLDWTILPKEYDQEVQFEGEPVDNEVDKDKKTTVLVVAIHNSVLNTYQDIVTKSSLHASFFEIEMFSAMRAVLENEQSPVMIFDMGAATTKLYVVEKGVIKNSHLINRGSQDITLNIASALNVPVDKAEKIKRAYAPNQKINDKDVKDVILLTLDYIFSETNSFILNYQKKYNKMILKTILTGGGVALNGLLEFSKSGFETDAVLGNPFAKVETPAFLEEILRLTGPEFSVAVGIALRKLQEFE
ncbi:MAG: type IV pilus assembly protein PilM [Candidatus Paceibacterota bacterium]